MPKTVLALALLLAATLAAPAAELPSRKNERAPANEARSCEFKGKKGLLTPDGQTCMVIGGYISGQMGFAAH